MEDPRKLSTREILTGTVNRFKTRTIEAVRKVQPNEKCKCGSGKKFKKCCMYKGLRNEVEGAVK